MQVVVGISGASGSIYALRLLEVLRELDVEVNLIVTKVGERVITLETGLTRRDLATLAAHVYDIDDLTGPLSSGSCETNGMVVIPCSMKTLAGIAAGYSSNLLLRVADVALKEKRPLVLVPRETPLSIIHLRNMYNVAQAGAVVLPAMPGFYNRPQSIEDLVNHIVGKILDVLGLEHHLYRRWEGI